MSPSAVAALLGLTLALGLGLLLDYVFRGRRIALADRVAPHFGEAPRGGPMRWRGVGWLGTHRPGDAALARALSEAGLPADPVRFRQGDLVAACLAALVVVALLTLMALRTAVQPLAGLLLMSAAVACTLWARREWLRRAGAARKARMEEQFPALAELLALAVAAGDSIGPALGRCSTALRGELADEVRRAVAEVKRGSVLPTVLRDLAARLKLDALTRCVDAIAVASERGTPLAAVLRDQAADAREAGRRALIESAGRKEVAMLVPVVFGVLPLSVLFAVYPGLELLTLGL
ncbi:MAG: type II secretion system F family protein [Arthrobacter sp.]|jgi:tight adherence protein C|nr:type II secretion system F family protein [Arthrobacter sp.]